MSCSEAAEGAGGRVERLLRLLEDGKTNVATLREAASQAGDLAATLPSTQVHDVAHRLSCLLHKKQWSLRSSAASALGALAQALPSTVTSTTVIDVTPMESETAASCGCICLCEIDPERVSRAQPLLSSDGTEFDLPMPECESRVEQVRRARNALLHRLGIGDAERHAGLTAGMEHLVEERDLNAAFEVQHTGSGPLDNGSGILGKRARTDYESQMESASSYSPGMATPAVGVSNVHEEWPLERICDKLLVWLFHENWQARHGAASALTAIIRGAPRCAGVRGDMDKDHAAIANARWCEDVCARLVCLLGLDRFNDFVEDTAIAPVREGASQALAACVAHVGTSIAKQITVLLLQFVRVSSTWEPRQGALLGLKCVLGLHPHIATGILAELMQIAPAALRDGVDDVVSTACAALEPIVDTLLTSLSDSQLHTLLASIWYNLECADPLSGCTGSALSLLTAFFSQTGRDLVILTADTLETQLDRIAQNLQHPAHSTRRAAFQCVHSLLQHLCAVHFRTRNATSASVAQSVHTICLLALQSSLLEPSHDVACDDIPLAFQSCLQFYRVVLSGSSLGNEMLQSLLDVALRLLETPTRASFPSELFAVRGPAKNDPDVSDPAIDGRNGGADDSGRVRCSQLVADLCASAQSGNLFAQHAAVKFSERLGNHDAEASKTACWVIGSFCHRRSEEEIKIFFGKEINGKLHALLQMNYEGKTPETIIIGLYVPSILPAATI